MPDAAAPKLRNDLPIEVRSTKYVLYIIKFSNEGYNIILIFGQKTTYQKEIIVLCEQT